MALPNKNKFVLVEYLDEAGMKQSPLFGFMFDSADRKKSKLMGVVYEQMKNMKTNSKGEEQRGEADSLQIL